MKNTPIAIKHKTPCPVCKGEIAENLGEHIKKLHGEKEFAWAVLTAKENDMPDPEIGVRFNITFRQLEKIITEAYGINISVLKRPKKIKYWAPGNFKEETTTVWSFKQRGDWATHDGRYRGNWSPYIPRNVILKYSKLGDTVLDYFVGGGTTVVEAKLLGRRCVAKDINPAAIGLIKENLKFEPPKALLEDYPVYEPVISVGDARDLGELQGESIDLICAHPPYAGIISYSSKIEGDLSKLALEDFLSEMRKVARESYRVLKSGGKCAVLLGDTRRKRHVIPIGFQTINVFLDAGFKLRELVIKRQHNCKTTGFWYEKSLKHNFLLLAHEYLPILEKPTMSASSSVREIMAGYRLVVPIPKKPLLKRELDELETTTVWVLPEKDWEKCLNKNVIDRYSSGKGYSTILFVAHSENRVDFAGGERQMGKGLLFIKSPFLKDNLCYSDIEHYLKKMREVIELGVPTIDTGGFLVVQTQDARIDGYVEPLAKRVVDLVTFKDLWLKEIVVVTPEKKESEVQASSDNLEITHQYLMVYEVVR